MDKKLFVHLQGGRKVSGTLRGYDLFLNLVIDNALEESTPAQKHPLGTIVRVSCIMWYLLKLTRTHSLRSYVGTVSHLWKLWKHEKGS
jgi:small nuclear ribonucleoprotein (snRNP)-like protein